MADIKDSKIFENIEGIRRLGNALVVLVKTEWNAAIVDELENGCREILNQHDIDIKTIVVPGAIEIPFAIQQYWSANNAPSAFIALACVIRGGTPHFDYVCQSITSGITQLNISMPVPVIFGVLTVDDLHQAEERTGGAHGHKGREAAITAIKMMILNNEFKKEK